MSRKRNRKWSVMLMYPLAACDHEPSTFYCFVTAGNRDEAVHRARLKLLKANEWTTDDYALEDLEELLVLKGWRRGV